MVDFIKSHHIYVMFLWYALTNFAIINTLDWALIRKPKMEFGLNMLFAIFLALAWIAITQKQYAFGIGLWVFITLFARSIYKILFPQKPPSSQKDEQIPNP